jgi:hypothetical protein
MEQEREPGGTRARVEQALETRDLTLRLLLAERAIAESAARIAELTGALAQLTEVTQPSVAADVPPVVVDADAVSPFALGFYQREFDKLGRPFRWTGKSDLFEIRLRLNRSAPWSFALELQPNPNVDTRKLRAFVDYIEIPVAIDDAGKTVSGAIPERYFGTAATVTFLLPNTFVPSTVNPAVQDNRALGVIFYELRAGLAEAAARPATDGERNEHESSGPDAAPKVRRRVARAAADATETAS